MPFSPAGEIAALDGLDALNALAGEPWRLDGSRSTVAFEVPRLRGFGTVRGRFTRYQGTRDLTPALVAGELAIVADTFVMHRGLGITWNPTGFTRPSSRLICAGTLVPVAPPAPLERCAPAGATRCGAHRLPPRTRSGGTGRRGPRAPREFRQR